MAIKRWIIIIVGLSITAIFAIFAIACARPPYTLGCLVSDLNGVTVAWAGDEWLTAPEAVDWRTYYTPRDQGRQSSCVGFAVSAALGKALSPAFIYNQRATSNCRRDAGMSIYNALQIVTMHGDCLELLMPYNPGNSCDQPDATALSDAASRKAAGYAAVFTTQGSADLNALRSHVAAGTPIILAVPVYRSFFDHLTGTIPVHRDGETFYGGHALLLVGYDAGGFWALNSWGPTSGQDGFVYLSNAFVQADAWEGWIITDLVGAPATLFVDVYDPAGQPVIGGSVSLWRDGIFVLEKTNTSGYLQFDIRTPGRYCVRSTPPMGWVSISQVDCLTSGDRLILHWQRVTQTPSPTTTATTTFTPTPTATATPYIEPTINPTILPPATPTPGSNAPRWALLSWWGSWGLVGDHQPEAIHFLAVPREDWPMIRRQVYLAQGSSLPQYDVWSMSKLGYALYNAECGAVLTPPVVVVDEAGQDRYLAVGTAAGILVVEAQ